MANHRLRTTGEVGVFFIYDHDVLKREEDDMKDAILYFYPPYISIDDQCSVCGQLMGVSEFLRSAISKSAPSIFKLHQEKYCLKRVRNYTFALEGLPTDSNELLRRQLTHLYQGFIFIYGDIDNVRQQYKTHVGFLTEMKVLWEMLFPSASCLSVNHIERVFQVLPSVEVNSDLFLQASNILQSSQRRQGVTLGAVLYKQRVLCTQMSPELTRKLILIRPELPCAEMKTDFPLPLGVRLVTVYLTDEEYSAIKPQHRQSSPGQYRHSENSKFVWGKDTPGPSQKSESPRRFTKDDSMVRRPSSRNDRNYSGRNSNMEIIPEIIPEIQSSVLSDITYVECKKKVETTYSENSGETKTLEKTIKSVDRTENGSVKGDSGSTRRKVIVTVSGEDSETISDLEDNEEETLMKVPQAQDNNSVKNDSKRLTADVIVHYCQEKLDVKPLEISSEKLPKIVTDHESTALVATETDRHLHSTNISSVQENEIRNEPGKNENDALRENRHELMSSVEQSKGHNSAGAVRKQSIGVFSESEETGTESVYGTSVMSGDESCVSFLSSPEHEENKETMVFRGSNYETTGGEESSVEGGVSVERNLNKVSGHVTIDTPDTSIETVHNSGSFESQTTVETYEDSELSWLPEEHGLHEMTLYIQSHSDVCLMLLMEEESSTNKNVLSALYKSSLTSMAEMDYYVKECVAQSANEGFMDSYNFLRYDSFFQTVKGNALEPLTGEDEEFHRLSGQMHSDFEENPGMANIIFRSHGGSCYGNKTINNETYFCMTNQTDSRSESGPLSKDPVFSLDLLARQKLSKSYKITLL
ncbi:uncharacterized protein LOC117333450 [Pecten maximus]|uniref:uncharacterized protein LOC117333450 n=1 Tax=Pecten maximus TaxID=6579 RepID=UPI001458EDFD|nr:uncharacterized protein LOC117333450 [Pecten maximus]